MTTRWGGNADWAALPPEESEPSLMGGLCKTNCGAPDPIYDQMDPLFELEGWVA